MDKLIHGPKAEEEEKNTKNGQSRSDQTTASNNTEAVVHRFDESNLIEDFKVLFTKPRFFFSFFAHPKYYNGNVWAKVLLVSLGLSALNSFMNPISVGNFDLSASGLDPITQRKAAEVMNYLSTFSLGILNTIAPLLTLVTTALGSAFTLLLIKMVGAKTEHLRWSSIFLIFMTATWANIFGFLPIAGSVLTTIVPVIFCTIGVAEVAHISKLRSFFAIYILPTILISVLLGVFAMLFAGLAAFAF